MTTPATPLPALGNTSWYTYAQGLDAAVRASVAKAGDTMTGDLVISKSGASSRLYDTTGTVDQRHVRTQMSGSNLAIQHLTDASGFVRNMILLRLSTGQVDLSGAVSVAVPAATAAAHAAQVSAINATTGQLAVGGRAIGDTGWRNVAPINGWTGTLLMRRVGQLVECSLNGVNGAAQTAARISFLPVGFRGGAPGADATNGRVQALMASTHNGLPQAGLGVQVGGTSNEDLNGVGAGAMHGRFSFLTSDAWPTTLPGTAA